MPFTKGSGTYKPPKSPMKQPMKGGAKPRVRARTTAGGSRPAAPKPGMKRTPKRPSY